MPGLLGEGGCPETMPWEGCGVGDDADLDMPGLLGEGGRPETRRDLRRSCPAFREKGAVRRRVGCGVVLLVGDSLV